MFLLIDNYDSFSYNLVHYLGELGVPVDVRRNDALSASDAMAKAPDGIVISPGPGMPEQSGICLDLVKAAAEARMPLLGVCLGNQAIGQAFGARIARANSPMHGKVSAIDHHGEGVFQGLASPLQATRYHSLIVTRDSLPGCLAITAETDDGTIMGLRHRDLPIHGVQFHPESIASELGHELLANFIELATGRRAIWPPVAEVAA